MFNRIKTTNLDDYFTQLDRRKEKGVYFYRINGYNQETAEFLQKYYEESRLNGVIVEGGIPNPDGKSLAYYGEVMGMDFAMNKGFITQSLQKWLPRMNMFQRENVSTAIYDALDNMRKKGKNDNILKNSYIKLMCGLYYKFERIVNKLGTGRTPKILYEGYVNSYEIMLLSVLSKAGSDIVILQYAGDAGYLRVDPKSEFSDNFSVEGAFPQDFSLKVIRQEIQNRINKERLYGALPDVENCTNAWIEGKGLPDILTAASKRGNDTRFFYNCFIRINGVEDKTYYINELFKFYSDLKQSGRKIVVTDGAIPRPTPEEISKVNRGEYNNRDVMLMDLSKAFSGTGDTKLKRILNKAFIDIMLETEREQGSGGNLNKLKNKAVYILSWINRYFSQLFSVGKGISETGCFIHMGGCRDENEALFLRFLSRLPVDVLILKPDLNDVCCVKDKLLYEINHDASLTVDKFPTDSTEIRVGTAAYHAERELDNLMYRDSGMYRDRQYSRAAVITLQTMYEEIEILWNEELKYRPNFTIVNDTVNMPVIFAKVSGVKNGDINHYWSGIKKLMTSDTYFISNVPFINAGGANPIKASAAEFFRNGRIQKERIKSHRAYQYGFLKSEIQDYILDKLQILIDQRLIQGTFQNGMEYNIIAVVLNMKKEIVRMIQNFDFTKKNPKLIYLYTSEASVTVEDAILTAFLNLIGFDVVFFVPTGYQCVEKYFNKDILIEHQCGEYMYDLRIPDFRKVSTNDHVPWHKKLFKRGS